MKTLLRFPALLTLALAARLAASAAEPAEIDLVRITQGGTRPIPIHLTGFTGEVGSALNFDLFVQGFETVPAERAVFQVSGSNNGQVQGRLSVTAGGRTLFAKAYSGGNVRAQAHALADDIVAAITGRKGIAQTKIAFRRNPVTAEGDGEIYVADFDGKNAIAVTSDGTIVAAPTWVPARRTLLYTTYMYKVTTAICAHDLATGNRDVVARFSGLNTGAAVSPDGKRVAMVLSKGGSPNIWTANLDGTGLKQLTSGREDDSSPCWSPDGRTICFSSRTSGRPALYTIPAGGGQPQRLRVGGVLNATEPDWSPDGKQIVFTRQAGAFEICVVPAGGGDASVLVAGEDPSWAPNSRTVIYARRSGSKKVLSMLDVPTKRAKELPSISGSCSQPSWSK